MSMDNGLLGDYFGNGWVTFIYVATLGELASAFGSEKSRGTSKEGGGTIRLDLSLGA